MDIVGCHVRFVLNTGQPVKVDAIMDMIYADGQKYFGFKKNMCELVSSF